MKLKIKVILLIVLIISLFRVSFILLNDKNIYHETKKDVKGVITYIKKDNDKIVFDIKSDNKYRITTYNKFNYNLGDKLLVSGVFINPSNNTVFNLFNYRKYLLSKNIKEISNNPKIELISKNKNILYLLKNKMIKHIEKYKTKKYLKAFVMGDTSDFEEDIKESYRSVGISHLLAISGMHVGVFLLILNFLLKKVKYKYIIVFMFLLLFLFITNFSESLMRCTLFIFLNYLNKKFKLKIDNIYVIMLTGSILLLINPYLIYSVGFLFSVIITFFIILSRKLLENKSYFRKTLIISVICFLASIPILTYYFFSINLLTPIFNLLFVPIVSFIIFPLGLITFIFPFFDNLYFFILNIFEYLVLAMSKIKILSFVIAKPSIYIFILYYLFLYLSFKVNEKYILFFVVVLIFNINAKFFILDPEIIFLDVGQGDSTVIILPQGKTILVDTGGIFMSNSSVVKNKTIPYLNSRGINNIDLLILTHGDYDHMGEAKTLLDNIKVGKVLINKGNINKLEEDILNYNNAKIVDNNYVIDNHELLFLNDKIYDNENSNSIVTYLNIKNNNILLMGDADKIVENNIINEYNLPKMDILKVGHHGSNTSSDINFIKNTDPVYSVISVGKNNRYGHPNKTVLDTLKYSNILRTDKNGSIRFIFKQNMVNKIDCKPYIIVER